MNDGRGVRRCGAVLPTGVLHGQSSADGSAAWYFLRQVEEFRAVVGDGCQDPGFDQWW